MVRQTPALKRCLMLGLAGLMLAPTGCLWNRNRVPEDSKPASVDKPTPPPPPKRGTAATQVFSTWRKEVQFGTDPVSQKPVAAVVGRMYLFDPSGSYPILGDGAVTVELFDDSQRAAGAPSKQLEKWEIDPQSLKKYAQKDLIGDGYTLALPWASYRPSITHIHFTVQYQPKAGSPIAHSAEILTIDHPSPDMLARKMKGAASDVVTASAKE